MYPPSLSKQAFLLFVCLPLAVLALTAGQGCPSPGPDVIETDAFGLDLVNNTSFEVDPGVQVDESLLELGTLAPLEGSDVAVAFDVDCFAGDTLTIEPILFLASDTQVLTANGPVVLEEGIDYVCGDIIRLEFSQDGTGAFFVDVFVNDVLINPADGGETNAFGLDLVNDTSFEVDPGVQVDEFLLGLGTLAPLEGSGVAVAFDVDCFVGDTLTIEPILFLASDTQVLTANGPVVLEEGIDYVCGDIIRLEFSQDGTGAFFVDVFVNDVLINP